MGVHRVCPRVTAEFLDYSQVEGNDWPHPYRPSACGDCALETAAVHAIRYSRPRMRAANQGETSVTTSTIGHMFPPLNV